MSIFWFNNEWKTQDDAKLACNVFCERATANSEQLHSTTKLDDNSNNAAMDKY